VSLKTIAVLVIFALWLAIQAFGFYGFGFEGLREGLDPDNYHGHPVDFAMHRILFVGPPLLAVIFWRAGAAQAPLNSLGAQRRIPNILGGVNHFR
jgi:hypothetical protein